MATVSNRSKYVVSVPRHDALGRAFPYSARAAVEAYVATLRADGHRPRVARADDCFEVRIRQKGFPELHTTVASEDEATTLIAVIDGQRATGLYYGLDTVLLGRIAMFDARIGHDDRHDGNLLLTPRKQLYLIDHERAPGGTGLGLFSTCPPPGRLAYRGTGWVKASAARLLHGLPHRGQSTTVRRTFGRRRPS
jgi:hypothetical protein